MTPETSETQVPVWTPDACYGERAFYWIMQCVESAQRSHRWPIRYWGDLAIDAACVFGAYGADKQTEKFVIVLRADGSHFCDSPESLRSVGNVFGRTSKDAIFFCYTDSQRDGEPRRPMDHSPESNSYRNALHHLGAVLTVEESING